MVHTAIFLGAGASKAEGAPLQGELFQEYFSSPLFKNSAEEMDRELATFFALMFQIDVDHDDIPNIKFPTFEEVLGLTDLAIMRKESFRNFDIDNRATNSGRLRFIAQYLVFLVAKVLDAKLRGRADLHRQLVSALHNANELRNIAFVSTNYDILIDNALTEEHAHGTDLDYGVEFRNFDQPGDWRRPALDTRVQLYKPHGSLNWLFCPTCNELEITPQEKGVVTRLLIANFSRAACPQCGSVFSPLIVPPTFYKDLNNTFLSTIWNRTDVALRKVKHIIFCGYSFPDADIHIKYLLKRAQTNRAVPLRITVINNHPGKKRAEAQQEQDRYKRFLGDNVNYTQKSFEDFVADPLAVLRW
jgi:NAD-dependent SIR2 family protein deacetylase